VREHSPGAGASSTMAHKANPVSAITARACAARAPGLAATLFASMEQEHQRAAGRWHAEWVTLTDLLGSTGSATAWLGDSLRNLVIDADRMRANAETTSAAAGLEPVPEPGTGPYLDRADAAHARADEPLAIHAATT
jgi:3-carboxy-cis,cis-muconate cycloisomerase